MAEEYDQAALDAASREIHMMLLREGSSWGTKACEEMGRVFMTAYRKALPSARGSTDEAFDNGLREAAAICIAAHDEQPTGIHAREVVKKVANAILAKIGKRAAAPAAAQPQEPVAWMVYQNNGSEFDYMVFANKVDAFSSADDNNEEPIPLYAAPTEAAAQPGQEAVEVGEKTGFYFEFGRGMWVKRGDRQAEKYPAGGLAYVGGLTKAQQEELDQLIDGYMVASRDDANRLTEYGIQRMSKSEALARLKAHITALEAQLDAEREKFMNKEPFSEHKDG